MSIKTVVIVGTDIHGVEDWWAWHNPEENPIIDERHRFDRAHRPSMDYQFDELAGEAEVDGLAIGLRTTRGEHWDTLPIFRDAIRASTRRFVQPPTVGLYMDTVGWPDMANFDDVDAPVQQPFDFLNDAHLQRVVDLVLGFYRVFAEGGPYPNPIWWDRTPDGRIVILIWGIASDNGHGMVHQHAAQRQLDAIARAMHGAGMGTPAFIVDKTWPQGLDVYGVHDWFDPRKTDARGRLLSDVERAHSIREHNGVTVGVMVPGFCDGPDHTPPHARVDRRDGQTAADVYAIMRARGVDRLYLESGNNRVESAGLMPTPARGRRDLHIMRDHMHATRPPVVLPPPDLSTGDTMIAVTEVNDGAVLYEDLIPGETDGTWAWILGTATPADKDVPGYAPGRKKMYSLQGDGAVGFRFYDPTAANTADAGHAGKPGTWESGRLLRNGTMLVFKTGGHVKRYWITRDI